MKRLIGIGICCGILILACSDRQRRNPLDPQAEDPQDDVLRPLQALALDSQVELRWDFSHFVDIEGYRLYRRSAGSEWGPITEILDAGTSQYIDADVQNGTSYEYRLGLVVEDQGERFSGDSIWAVPGAELAWIADRSTGLVWKISSDARSAHFAQGRFPDLADIAIDESDRSCWVSDRYFAGLYRIDSDGELSTFAALIEEPGELEIDPESRIGWLTDRANSRVVWFSLDAADSLEVEVVDASFASPVALAAQPGGCWIADQSQGRVIFYQTDGGRQVEIGGLEGPMQLAAGASEEVWLLIDEGRGLLRLDRSGEILVVDLPFATALSISVDRKTGACWAMGEQDIAVFSALGSLEQHWTEVSGGTHLFYDPVHRRVWISTGDALWKLTDQGEALARLDGFSSIVRIVVDPGRG